MSNAQRMIMADRLVASLIATAALLRKFAIRIATPVDAYTLNLDAAQRTLIGAQRVVMNRDYTQRNGINPETAEEVAAAIHEWLAAADTYRLYRDHGAFPHRARQFDIHMTNWASRSKTVESHAACGIAWARRV